MSNWLGGLLDTPASNTPASTPASNTNNGSKQSKKSKGQGAADIQITVPVTVPPVPSKNGKLLLLLDMNGTLLLRLKGKLGSASPAFSHAGLNYFIREGVHDLVRVHITHLIFIFHPLSTLCVATLYILYSHLLIFFPSTRHCVVTRAVN